MQKKYIIPVLMAVPTAMPMMADIALPNGDGGTPSNTWDLNGINGDHSVINGDQVTVLVGTSTVSQKLPLPAGKYILRFTETPENVKVLINGTQVTANADGEYNFEVTAVDFDTNKTTLTVTGADPALAFSFKGANLEIVFNAEETREELRSELGKYRDGVLLRPDFTGPVADALTTEGEDLQELFGKIGNDIRSIEESFTCYKKFKFYLDHDVDTEENKTQNTIAQAIADLSDKIATYQNELEVGKANNTVAVDLQLNLDALKALPGQCKTAMGENEQSFAYTTCNGELTDFTKKVNDYVEDFEKKTTDLTKALTDKEVQDLKDKLDTLTKDGKDLLDKITTANDDEKAYKEYQTAVALLDKTAEVAINKINLLAGLDITYKGEQVSDTNHFTEEQAEAREKVETEKANALKGCVITEMNGASKIWKENGALLTGETGAINTINNIVAEITNRITSMNDAYTYVNDAVNSENGLQASLDALKKSIEGLPDKLFPADFLKEVKETIESLQNRITYLYDTAVDSYVKRDLTLDKLVLGDETETTYKAEIDDIRETITNLDSRFNDDGYYEFIIDLSGKLNTVWEQINNDNEDPAYDFIIDKFEGTKDNILNSIVSLDPKKFAAGEYTQEELDALEDAITRLKNNAANMHGMVEKYLEMFKTAEYDVNTFITNIHSTEDFININDKFDVDSFQGLKDLQTKLDGFKEKYDAAKGKDAQDCYDALKKLVEEFGAVNFRAETVAAYDAFHLALTTSNYDQMFALWQDIQEKFNKGEICQLVHDNSVTPLRVAIIAARDAYNRAKNAAAGTLDPENPDATTAPIAGVGSYCIIADPLILEAYTLADNLLKSEVEYHKYDYEQTFALINANLGDLREYNDEISQSPAKEYYAGVIGAVGTEDVKSMQGRLDELIEAINYGHAHSTLSIKPENSSYETTGAMYEGELEALIAEGVELKLAILRNEKLHNMQLEMAAQVQDKIDEILAQIATYDPNYSNGWKEEIEAIRDKDLNKLNHDVAVAYSKGESATGGVEKDKNTYTLAYQDLLDRLTELSTQYEETYGNNVTVANNERYAAVWPAMFRLLNDTYTSSIERYNEYLKLTNLEYKDYIQETLTRHQDLYDYSAKITSLSKKIEEDVKEANKDNKVLTIADFNTIALDQARTYIDEMNGKVAELSKALNDDAEAFYTTVIEPRASKEINDARTELKNAGITPAIIEKTLEAANELYSKGFGLYNKTDKNAVAPDVAVQATIGFVMDEIANTFKGIKAAIDLEPAAVEYWQERIAFGVKAVAENTSALKQLTYLTEEEKAPGYEMINTVISEINDLNAIASTTTDLLANVKGYNDQLVALIETLTDTIDDLRKKNDAKVDEENAANKYNNDLKVLGNLSDNFQSFIDGLACESDPEVVKASAKISAAIANIENLLKENGGKLALSGETIDPAIEAANTAIAEAYKTASEQEIVALGKLETIVKVAYNDAFNSPDRPSNILDINATLDLLFEEIGKLQFEPNNPMLFKTTALTFESMLNNWIVQLETYDPEHGKTLDTILKDLSDLADEVAAAIGEGKAGVSEILTDAQKEAFNREYKALADRIEEIRTAFEGAGNNVISQADNFKADINAVSAELSKLNGEVQKAIEDAKAQEATRIENQANYDTLTAEITTLGTDLDELKARVDNYGYTEAYAEEIARIESRMAALQSDAKTAYDGIKLTGETNTKLETEAGNISHYILTLEIYTAKHHVAVAEHGADQAILAAWSALNPTDGTAIVPEMLKEAKATLSSLRWTYNEYDGRVDNWMENYGLAFETFPADIRERLNDLDTYADAFNEIAEAAKSVETDAADNKYIPGDVNDDKKVNFLDIQQVLNWVMAVTDIEELSPRVLAAADVNQDNLLNITDVTAIINLVMGENESQVRAAMGRRMVESNNTIYPELVSAENGVRRFAISLANSEVFANGQFDLKLAPGMMLESVTIGERAKSHEVLSQENSEFTRVAVVSMENAAIQGTDGAVVYVEVSGEGNIAIENAVFATPKAVGHVISNGETSAIDKVIEGARDLKERIYNAAGQQLDRVQRGINIIRKSDGTVTKELRK